MTDTRTVRVYDMNTGALLRVTTTAGEAQRALSLPTVGMTMADRLANKKPTQAQLKARQKKAERNAQRLAQLEASKEAQRELASVVVPFNVYSDMNTDWQAGYDY